jgi:hypothetical protein
MLRRLTSGIAFVAIVFVSVLGSASSTFAYSPKTDDVSTPSNLSLVGGIYTNDTTPTFTWNRPSGATWYEFMLDNGSWQSIGNVGSYTMWPLSPGWHTFFLRAHNNAGDISESVSLTFEIDTKGPEMFIANSSTTQNHKTELRVSTSSKDVMATWCEIVVNGKAYGMTAQAASGSRRDFTFPYTFYTKGSYSLHASCKDGDGNYATADKTIRVDAGSTTPAVSIARGTVVKTACDSYAPKSDTCHSIYYYGADGKRHGFTSEAVYQSWYGSSFANVVTISSSQMNAMPMGENVTMRPGTSLVKFMGSTTVYAVAKGGVLRPIVNEAVAKAIYGSRWNSVIVTLPGSVKSDYTFGEKIDSSSDYSKSQTYYSVTSIDDNF